MALRGMVLCLTLAMVSGCTKEGAEAERDWGPAPPPPVAAVSEDHGRRVIVAFGDSLSAGFGLEAGYSYPNYLQKELDRAGYAYKVVPEALSGDTSGGGVARLTQILAHKPEIVILELGANDGLRGIPVEKTRENLDLLIGELKQSGAKVLLAGITLPRNYGADYIREFDRMYPELAKKHGVKLLPFLLEGVALRKELMLADALHPNPEGNRMVARTVMLALVEMLEK